MSKFAEWLSHRDPEFDIDEGNNLFGNKQQYRGEKRRKRSNRSGAPVEGKGRSDRIARAKQKDVYSREKGSEYGGKEYSKK